MKTESAPYAPAPTGQSDARVTRVGRILRGSCLDELPQLINVLRGDMSLVGPRPEMPFIVETYGELARRRLVVKPGITGLWQLRGPRDRHIHESLHLDLHYIQHWTLWLDMCLIVETVFFVLARRNC